MMHGKSGSPAEKEKDRRSHTSPAALSLYDEAVSDFEPGRIGKREEGGPGHCFKHCTIHRYFFFTCLFSKECSVHLIHFCLCSHDTIKRGDKQVPGKIQKEGGKKHRGHRVVIESAQSFFYGFWDITIPPPLCPFATFVLFVLKQGGMYGYFLLSHLPAYLRRAIISLACCLRAI